jgi:cation transport ATPase
MADVATSCAYCGLPATKRRCDAPAYCCFGCRFAAAVADAAGEEAQTRWLMTRLGLSVFFSLNVVAFTMALWSSDVYGPDEAGRLSASLVGLFRYLSLLLTIPVLLLLGLPLATSACDGMRQGQFSTDLLLILGVAAAVAYSVVSVVREHGPVYFEIACAVLVLVSLGRWLEASGKLHANEAIDALEKLLPETVRVVTADGMTSKPLADVRAGELLLVGAGACVPSDGIVRRHPVTVDERILTGESLGRVKEPGDTLLAGAFNMDSDLVLEVAAEPGVNALTRLTAVLRDARNRRGPYERLADRLARVFLPVVIATALCAALWHTMASGLDQGILTGLAVVLIACPCALGVATPLAVWASLGQAVQRGILFRSAEGLERLATVRAVAFDKTGTLTTGQAQLADWVCDSSAADEEVWRRTRLLTANSTHGLARALQGKAQKHIGGGSQSAPVQTLPGRGLAAADERTGSRMFLGSRRLMEERRTTPRLPGHGDRLRTAVDLAFLGWQGTCSFYVQGEAAPGQRGCTCCAASIRVGRLCPHGRSSAPRRRTRPRTRHFSPCGIAARTETRGAGPTARAARPCGNGGRRHQRRPCACRQRCRDRVALRRRHRPSPGRSVFVRR